MNKLYTKITLILASFIATAFSLQAQNVTITPGGITPALSGTYPRITYDAILALPNPQKGDIAYDINFDCLRVYTNNKWLCTFQSPGNFSPNLLALAFAGGIDSDTGREIATDASGNIYIIGEYRFTISFGATSKTSLGGLDIFIAKYNKTGILQWVQSAGGINDEYGYDIATDASGNVYITGTYQGTVTFGGFSKTSAGMNDVFIAKCNSSGTFQWLQSAGGTNYDAGIGITINASGNVCIVGQYYGTTNFSGVLKTSAGSGDIFIARYDSNGTLEWVVSAGGPSADIAIDIVTDAGNNLYVTGYYQSTAVFGGFSKTAVGIQDIFVVRYNTDSSVQWVQSAGGPSGDYPQGIAIDANANLYVVGYFFGTATFSPGYSKTAINYDTFIVKYNSSGVFQWVQATVGTAGEAAYDVATDASNNVYITGSFRPTATFGNISKTALGVEDVFVAKYHSNGIFQWVQSAGGTNSTIGFGITTDNIGNIYVTGEYQETALFGSTSSTSAGYQDMFLIRLDK